LFLGPSITWSFYHYKLFYLFFSWKCTCLILTHSHQLSQYWCLYNKFLPHLYFYTMSISCRKLIVGILLCCSLLNVEFNLLILSAILIQQAEVYYAATRFLFDHRLCILLSNFLDTSSFLVGLSIFNISFYHFWLIIHILNGFFEFITYCNKVYKVSIFGLLHSNIT
jgi:hypothetical protein